MTSKKTERFEKLKQALLAAPPHALESLVGAQLGNLLGVQFRQARSGSQHGGDGGVRGIGGRDLVFEARRYGERSRLNSREIRGEIQEAVERIPHLEAWILVTTQKAPEQVVTAMTSAGAIHGIDTIVIDWSPGRLPVLAALCASNVQSFEEFVGQGFQEVLREIAKSSEFSQVLARLKSRLGVWAIGYELLRRASHRRVCDIWDSRRKSMALFNQNVAGLDPDASHIERSGVMAQLDDWDAKSDLCDPAIVFGPEGTGKTWASLDWLQSRLAGLPIVILVPSSSITKPITSRSGLIELLARCLLDLDTKVERNHAYWEMRVKRLLRRPLREEPVFLIFLDGLNEQPSYDWTAVLNVLRDDMFHLRARILLSTRTSFLSQQLTDLCAPDWRPVRIEIGRYDLAADGEFDRKLAAAGLSRKQLPESLIELASVPRLFDLVVQLRSRLGEVERVTVHRLLWEYGASTIPVRPFGAQRWREFILKLAGEFREGRTNSTQDQLEKLTSSAGTPVDQIYRRVSTVIDGAFATLNEYGELEFEPPFVWHALGLALVKKLEGISREDASAELERFFQPINDYDDKAEIVRAAVSIALTKHSTAGSTASLGALCSAWVQTQNLPRSHVTELTRLASELVSPLLDAVENTAGHASAAPRAIAVAALANVDPSDHAVARAIATRSARWLRFISQERRSEEEDDKEESLFARRRERLLSRIGTCDAGVLTVLGREVEIVTSSDNDLESAATQLLQGRPLVNACDFLEAAALHFAISGDTGQGLPWLNIVNHLDPAETAVALRSSAKEMAERIPEPGVHVDLNKRVAAILLWWTGYKDDELKALDVDPGIDTWYSYTEDYLKDPPMSLHRLERRHTTQTLLRTDIPIKSRMGRTGEFILDPTISIPHEFTKELVTAADKSAFEKMAQGRWSSSDDFSWNRYSLALARSAPGDLARIERARMRGFAKRRGEPRLGAALVAPETILLVDSKERTALAKLRQCHPDLSEHAEKTIAANLLMVEVYGLPPLEQFEKIKNSKLNGFRVAFGSVCASPSTDELDQLLTQYESHPNSLAMIAAVFREKHFSLSDQAFHRFASLLWSDDENIKLDPLWILLGTNSPRRLGAALEERAWSWSPTKGYVENLLGSRALATANRNEPFEKYAERLVPTELLRSLSIRECSQEDVRLTIELLNKVVFDTPVNPPQANISAWHDRESAQEMTDYLFTVGDLYEDKGEQDDVRNIVAAHHSPEKYEERWRSIANRYHKEVLAARESGAHFHFGCLDARDFDVVIRHCPEAVDTWLDGMDEGSNAFVRRALLANGFFVPLCEALLLHAPGIGVKLWRALRRGDLDHLRYTVFGDMDRLVHALFRAKPCAEVDEALNEVYGVEHAPNDKGLMDLVVAARLSNRLNWLREMVARDRRSACPLNNRRAEFIEPLLTVPELAGDTGWPEGESGGDIKSIAWRLAQREAFARHWLISFAKSHTLEEAHAHWRLFLASADRRAWSWISNVLDETLPSGDINSDAKRRFVVFQSRRLKRAMTENEKWWSNNYAGRSYPENLWPWNGEVACR